MDYTFALLVVFMIVWSMLSLIAAFQETTVQTCANEVFQARCPFSQKLLITQARYGAIEASRCVDDVFEELGLLGCFANVTNIVGSKCNSHNRCEIDVEDPDIVASKTCTTGLPMYMDTSYVCIPETITIQSCNAISVNRQMQYLLTKDIWDHHCFYDLEQNVNVDFSSESNLKIKMNVQPVTHTDADANAVYVMHGDEERTLLTEQSQEIQTDHLTLRLTNQQSSFLIGFQAFGCDDMVTPAYSWISREGDDTTVGCYHSHYEWKMSCVGSKWIGPRSNCTDKKQEAIKPTPTPTLIILKLSKHRFLPQVTFLVCLMHHVDEGFIFRSKYTYEAKSAPYEMATMMSDPSNTATWQKAKLQGNNDTLILPVNSLQEQTLQLR
ncbi:hypothetical protein CAPTEDRAFT_193941 [Capitella teleta]|uniref:SUEL-type lectin domain-containing protein n=1 Tax=Capitella teleta TaxID=283909 RepID=R7TJ66_CAPTE|nr:hypothetical protein CAPTEDRAFT_193941 [Capitella teleta]|eukprot:ELT93838.1 hypothetical protein CAPTEDRAFT_193941 [Capitella teleta]